MRQNLGRHGKIFCLAITDAATNLYRSNFAETITFNIQTQKQKQEMEIQLDN